MAKVNLQRALTLFKCSHFRPVLSLLSVLLVTKHIFELTQPQGVVQLELPVASFKLSGDTSDVEQIAQGAKRKSGGRTYQRDSISCILPPPKHSSSSKTRYHGASSQPTKRQKTIENEKELLSVESHTNDTESDAAHFASRSAATHYPLTPSESQVNHDTAPSSTSDNVSQLGVNTHPSLDLPVEVVCLWFCLPNHIL